MNIFVGVLTHNAIANMRWPLVERTMASILAAFPDAKVVICDNGSTDETAVLLRDKWGGSAQSRAVQSHHAAVVRKQCGNNNAASGRNFIINWMLGYADPDAHPSSYCGNRRNDWFLLSGDLVVLSDDDMEWRPNAGAMLRELWSETPPSLALVSGLLEPEYPWSKQIGVVPCGHDPVIQVELRATAPAAAWTFPAWRYDHIGPFSVDADTGEDVLVCKHLAEMGLSVGQVDLAKHIGQGYSLCGNDQGREIFGGAR